MAQLLSLLDARHELVRYAPPVLPDQSTTTKIQPACISGDFHVQLTPPSSQPLITTSTSP
jgi:hypothetical protein